MPTRTLRCVPMALAFAVLLLMPTVSAASATSASAEPSMVSVILSRMNADRFSLGLRAIRIDSRIARLASDRADWMASTGDLTHEGYGGQVWDALAARAIATYSSGEAIGSTTAAWGAEAADYLYGLWRGSPEHYGLMMSDTYNYVGIGLAYRASTGETYATLVFAEGPDNSRPVAEVTSAGVSGQSVFFAWTGRDGMLQSHTAGLRDFDVAYSVDSGPWVSVLTHTTLRQLILPNRAPGHTYAVRVRDRDRRNNVSPWSAVRTVAV